MADSMLTDNSKVAITGASGFIGSHITRILLERGYRVRGTVRKPDDKEAYPHLRSLPGAFERLDLVSGQLLTPGDFDKAVEGCGLVLHTASPYVLDVKDAQKDLVDPAVEGTRNVLSSCAKTDSVKRVVLTSSMAAVTDEPESDHVLTEGDWNTKSTLKRNPYYYSKTMAERAAWDFMKENSTNFGLVVINPFMVIGPSLTPKLNTSNQVFVDLLNGTYPGIMNLTWGFVDVRDTAMAHVLAAESPKANGRNLCVADKSISMREVVKLLSENGYADRKLPKLGLDCSAGDYMVKLSSYFQPKGVGSYLRTHVGRIPQFDNSKIQKELGLSFQKVPETILDTMKDLKNWGHIK